MLIDELLWLQGTGSLPHPWDAAPLRSALVVRMDNVFRLAQALGGGAGDFDDLVPNVAPLAPAVWCEVCAPAFRWAAFLTAIDVPDGAERALVWEDLYGRHGLRTRDEHAGAAAAWPTVRWVVLGLVPYEQPDTGELRLPRLPVHLWLDPGGHVSFRHWLWSGPIAPESALADEEMALQETFLNTALIGICFAHCKGVSISEHAQPRQQRRAAERGGHAPLVTYKTIDIAPVTRVLRQEGQIEKTGIRQALHLCRGHFAHYTEDAPLFGRYTGTFYRPMHVRGALARGAVVKDYRVLAPKEKRKQEEAGR